MQQLTPAIIKQPSIPLLLLISLMLINHLACSLKEEDFPELEFFEVTTENITINGSRLLLKAFVSGLEKPTYLSYGYFFFEEGSENAVDTIIDRKKFLSDPHDFNKDTSIKDLNLNLLCNYQVQAYAFHEKGRRILGEKVDLMFTSQLSLQLLDVERLLGSNSVVVSAEITGLNGLQLKLDDHGYLYDTSPFNKNELSQVNWLPPLGSREKDGAFEKKMISGLEINTPYYIGAYIKLHGKFYLSPLVEFRLLDSWSFFVDRARGIASGIAVTLKDRVYFGLGSTSPNFFDPSGDFWSMDAAGNIEALTPLPEEATYRTDAVAFAVEDTIYYGLGINVNTFTSFNDFWAFYPLENGGLGRWEKLAADPYPGGNRSAAVAFSIDRKGYVGSGRDEDFISMADFYVFDPSKAAGEKWRSIASIGVGVTGNGEPSIFPGRTNAVAFSIVEKGYVGLGTDLTSKDLVDFWEFTPNSGAGLWRQLDSDLFPAEARHSVIGFEIDERAYLGTGSQLVTGASDRYFSDFWQFDPAQPEGSRWIPSATFIDQERSEAIGFSIGKKGYLLGGLLDNGVSKRTFKEIWEYTPPPPN